MVKREGMRGSRFAVGICALLLLSACTDSTEIQRRYVDMRDHCRENAENDLPNRIPDGAEFTEGQQNALLTRLFSKCMEKQGWIVATSKTRKEKNEQAGLGGSPGSIIQPSAATVAKKAPGTPAVNPNEKFGYGDSEFVNAPIGPHNKDMSDIEEEDALDDGASGQKPSASRPYGHSGNGGGNGGGGASQTPNIALDGNPVFQPSVSNRPTRPVPPPPVNSDRLGIQKVLRKPYTPK